MRHGRPIAGWGRGPPGVPSMRRINSKIGDREPLVALEEVDHVVGDRNGQRNTPPNDCINEGSASDVCSSARTSNGGSSSPVSTSNDAKVASPATLAVALARKPPG